MPTDTTQAAPDSLGPGGTYEARCAKMAAVLCGAVGQCCGGQQGDCLAEVLATCVEEKGKVGPMVAAAKAGKLVLDPVLDQTCDTRLAALGTHCNERDFGDVFLGCLLAWVDPAGLGQPCITANNKIQPACAAGQGRCVLLDTADPAVSLPTCVTAAAIDAPCASKAPCVLGGLCAGLTGPNVCRAFGQFCWAAGDVSVPCPGGLTCQGTTCVPDTGAATGQACTADADCRQGHDCTGAVCVPKICDAF